MRRRGSRLGFTLVEIMIVVAIIGTLSAMGVPSFLRARKRARATRFVNDLRVATEAFHLHDLECGYYPPGEEQPKVIPEGMADYLSRKLDWTNTTCLGGEWLWEVTEINGFDKYCITVINPRDSRSVFEVVDEMIDDGSLASGNFRMDVGSEGGAPVGPVPMEEAPAEICYVYVVADYEP